MRNYNGCEEMVMVPAGDDDYYMADCGMSASHVRYGKWMCDAHASESDHFDKWESDQYYYDTHDDFVDDHDCTCNGAIICDDCLMWDEFAKQMVANATAPVLLNGSALTTECFDDEGNLIV